MAKWTPWRRGLSGVCEQLLGFALVVSVYGVKAAVESTFNSSKNESPFMTLILGNSIVFRTLKSLSFETIIVALPATAQSVYLLSSGSCAIKFHLK